MLCRWDSYEAFLYFTQETAYEVRLSIVGSEICIRDCMRVVLAKMIQFLVGSLYQLLFDVNGFGCGRCLLYISDAADEYRGVVCGGTLITKKTRLSVYLVSRISINVTTYIHVTFIYE